MGIIYLLNILIYNIYILHIVNLIIYNSRGEEYETIKICKGV